MPLQLVWRKCNPGVWCSFTRVDLDKIDDEGVYVIWHGGNDPRVVYVGQGDVVDRLRRHRQDKAILQHERKGGLYVTWTAVPEHDRSGVERFLADVYKPLEGDVHPNVSAIQVNSPWK